MALKRPSKKKAVKKFKGVRVEKKTTKKGAGAKKTAKKKKAARR
jgi:hypothetical protein